MANDIFKIIGNFIGGTSDKTQKKDSNEIITATDGIEKKEKLKNAVINTLASYFKGDTYNLDRKMLLIHVIDSVFYESLSNSDFLDELRVKMSDELGVSFKNVSLDNDDVSDKKICTLVTNNVFLEIKDNKVKTDIKIVKISVLNKCGSIIGDTVEIDTEFIKTLPNQRVNIGRGQNSNLDDGTYRENYIAICDDEQNPQYKYNQHVSRCQAYIKYNRAFYLYVELGGCRITNGRTRLFRGGELFMDMNNPKMPVKLQNGDVIELAKSVNLLFSIID